MYPYHSKRQCLLCLEDLYQSISMYHLVSQPVLCKNCLSSFIICEYRTALAQYPILVLYEYNDFFRKTLFQYKGQYDIALKEVFVSIWKEEWKQRYRDYIIVIAPSSKEDNEVRGFVPNMEIVRSFSSNIFTGLYKKERYKQTDAIHRSAVKDVLAIRDGEKLSQKKVLLFDDVITSGHTLFACLDLVRSYHPKSIEIIVLASGKNGILFSNKGKNRT